MPYVLILLRCDRRLGEWARESRLTFEDDEHGLGAAKARAQGEAWVAESSDERRDYRVLASQAP
jgi:hypothetical protein